MSELYSIGRLTRRRTDGSTYWPYCITWPTDGGERRRLSLGTTDKAAAPALAREIWSQQTTGTAETIGSIVNAFLDTLPKPYPGWRISAHP
jgi:hypothetical protein